jgi:hypothetical protein
MLVATNKETLVATNKGYAGDNEIRKTLVVTTKGDACGETSGFHYHSGL